MDDQLSRPQPLTDEQLPPQQAEQPKKFWSQLDVFLITLVALALFLGGTFGLGALIGSLYGPDTAAIKQALSTVWFSIGVSAIEFIALFGGIYLLAILRKHLSWRALGLSALSGRWPWISLGLGIAVIIVSRILTIIAITLKWVPEVNPQLQFIVPVGLSWTSLVLMVVLLGIAIPFAEELFFRGVLHRFLSERWGIWIGTGISALLFALVHLDLMVGITAFVIGIVSALAYEYSRSLWTAVLIHSINNLFATIVAYLLLVDLRTLPLF